MRCWTDGNRSAFWKDGRLEWVCGDEVQTFEGFDGGRLYGPGGALAVHPSRDVVWVGGDRCATWRIDIASGARQRFDLPLADLCYLNDHELWGISGYDDALEHDATRRLLRFEDAADAQVETLQLPRVRAIRWPYGAAYQSSAPYRNDENLSAYADFRMTRSARGICIASTDGYIWGFPHDAKPFGWVVSPVYQGWLVAELVDSGVLATAQHNGRTGEVVRIDDDGCWVDAYDSVWNPISPAVQVTDGYLLGWNFNGARILGDTPFHPAFEIDGFGIELVDLHAAADGSMAVWVNRTERGVLRKQDAQWVIEAWRDEQFTQLGDAQGGSAGYTNEKEEDKWAEFYRAVAELGPFKPWKWQREYLSEFPELSPAIPDLLRAEELIAMLEKTRDSADPRLLESTVKYFRWNFPWYAWSLERLQKPRQTVFEILLRDDTLRRPTRAQARALAARAGDPELTDFERFHAQISLSTVRDADLNALSVEEVLDTMLRDAIEKASIAEQSVGVRGARLSGRLFPAGIGWSALVHLEDDSLLGIHCDFLRPNALSAPSTGDEAAIWFSAEGTYAERALVDLEIQVEHFKDHAHRLQIDAREPSISINCLVNFRGLFCPGVHDIDQAVALAAREIDLTGWYASSDADGVTLSVFADDLQNPQPCQNPEPHPGARGLVDRLVADELLELTGELSSAQLRRVQWILFSGLDSEQLIKSLEDTLLAMEVVDDLFGTGEELSACVAQILNAL